MTTVYAFDRDLTVDVNPHPERDAVPLGWVRSLADCDEVDVWAIGNQRLRYEADIPGLPELMRERGASYLHVQFLTGLLWFEWHLHRYPGLQTMFALLAPHVARTTMPPRVKRLRQVEDLYQSETTRIVVDDTDLSAVDGWTHYYPWDFVEAVSNGSLDIDVELATERDS